MARHGRGLIGRRMFGIDFGWRWKLDDRLGVYWGFRRIRPKDEDGWWYYIWGSNFKTLKWFDLIWDDSWYLNRPTFLSKCW